MGLSSKYIISIEALLATKGLKDFEQGIKSISSIEAKTRTYNKILKNHNLTQVQTDAVLRAAGLRISKNGEVVDKAGKKQRNYNKAIIDNRNILDKSKFKIANEEKSLKRRSNFYDKWTSKLNISQAELGNVMNKAGLSLTKQGNVVDKAGKKQRNFGDLLNRNSSAANKFQMSNLGVMFAGLALNRVMVNLNSTSREWVGMNEIMSIAMGDLMLPTTLDLLNFGVLPLFDALTNLPDPAKKAIGLLSLALEGLGKTMMVGGQLMLGANSTAEMLSRIFQISPNLVFTQRGLGEIGRKLGITQSKLMKIAKLAAVGITLKMAIDNLEEGDLTAAIGNATLGVGIYTGNPYLISIGLALTLTGEPDFLAKFFVFGLKIIDSAIALGEDIGNAIWAGISGGDFDSKFIRSFGESVLEELAKTNFKSDLLKSTYGSFLTLEGSDQYPLFKQGESGFDTSKRVNGNNNINIIQTNTISGFDIGDVKKEINKNNNSLTSEIRRIIKVGN